MSSNYISRRKSSWNMLFYTGAVLMITGNLINLAADYLFPVSRCSADLIMNSLERNREGLVNRLEQEVKEEKKGLEKNE